MNLVVFRAPPATRNRPDPMRTAPRQLFESGPCEHDLGDRLEADDDQQLGHQMVRVPDDDALAGAFRRCQQIDQGAGADEVDRVTVEKSRCTVACCSANACSPGNAQPSGRPWRENGRAFIGVVRGGVGGYRRAAVRRLSGRLRRRRDTRFGSR